MILGLNPDLAAQRDEMLRTEGNVANLVVKDSLQDESASGISLR